MSNMPRRIELEKLGRRADTILMLDLSRSTSTWIDGLTEEFVNLRELNMLYVGLRTLEGFPKLPNLLKLDLAHNRISNTLNLLATSPKLRKLDLSFNKIRNFSSVQPLGDLKELKHLYLHNNVIKDYKSKTFKLIPSLKSLDGSDSRSKIVDSDEENIDRRQLSYVQGVMK